MIITDFNLSFTKDTGAISFGQTSFEFKAGDLSLLLHDMPAYYITHPLQTFKEQQEIIVAAIKGEKLTDKEKTSIISTFINQIQFEYTHIDDSRIGSMLYLFPLAALITGYIVHYGYSLGKEDKISKSVFQDLVLFSEQTSKDERTVEIFPAAISRTEKTYIMLNHIKDTLLNVGNPLDSSVDLCAASEYCDSIVENLEQIKEVKINLASYLKEKQTPRSNLGELPKWILLGLSQAKNVKKPLSLTAIIAREQEYLYQKKHYTKVCLLCKNTFIAHKHSAKYCSNPNPDFDGKTCREIGDKEGPRTKMKLYYEFNSKRKSYCNWIAKNKTLIQEYVSPDEYSLIETEMDNAYHLWHTTARSAMVAYENNEIKKEEAYSSINLPAIKSRSPLFYERKPKI